MPDPRSNPAVPSSGSDIFLHVQCRRAGKIKGECSSPDHVDDIRGTRWSWGVQAGSAIGSGQATARRAYKHLVVWKEIDAASTSLLSALATNDEVKEAKLAMRKAGAEADDYFVILLGGARVVAIEVEVDEDGTPRERVEFSFTKVEVQYRRQETSGLAGASNSFSDEILHR